MHGCSIDVLLDDGGSVAIGWVGDGVLYAHCSGRISMHLGARSVGRLHGLVDRTKSLHCFADASGLEHYDVRALDDVVNLVRVYRRKFESIVMFTCSEDGFLASQVVAAGIADVVELVKDDEEFHSRLVQLAPLAIEVIESSGLGQKVDQPPPADSTRRVTAYSATIQSSLERAGADQDGARSRPTAGSGRIAKAR